MSWNTLPREIHKTILAHAFVPLSKFNPRQIYPGWGDHTADYTRICDKGVSKQFANSLLVSKEFGEDAKEAFFEQTIFNLCAPDILSISMNSPGATSYYDARIAITISTLAKIQEQGYIITKVRLCLWPTLFQVSSDSQNRFLQSLKAMAFLNHKLLMLRLIHYFPVTPEKTLLNVDKRPIMPDSFATVLQFMTTNVKIVIFTIQPESQTPIGACEVRIRENEVQITGHLRGYVDAMVPVLLNIYSWEDGTLFKLVHAWPAGSAARYATVGQDLKVTYDGRS